MVSAQLPVPDSTSTVRVSVIDSTAHLNHMPTSIFFGPEVKGFERFDAPALAFLIVHTDESTGKRRRLVFDLGLPKDWENDLAAPAAEQLKASGANIETSKYVSEILEENGVALDSLEAVVWSHPHLDHTGRVSLFPNSVTLLTGPGVKDALYPGYPTNPNSAVLERDFADREITELDFTTSSLTIGGFKAIDYFGDGSFYFLSAPGHAVGHINGLARTTQADTHGQSTFILMGADSYHHVSELRPNMHTPLPDEIPATLPHFAQYASACPGHIFDVIHPSHASRKDEIPAHYKEDLATNHADPKTSPYFTISSSPDGQSLAVDVAMAKDTIKGLQVLDVEDNIFLISAHDKSLFNVVDFFPKEANDWKAKGWKEKGKWLFLDDLYKAVEAANAKTS